MFTVREDHLSDGQRRINGLAPFTGPITANTSDEDLNTLAYKNGYGLGVPIQICAHLLKLERHILQLEQRLAVAPHLANAEKRG